MKLMSTCLFMRITNYKKNLDQKVKRAKHNKHTQHGSDRYILDILDLFTKHTLGVVYSKEAGISSYMLRIIIIPATIAFMIAMNDVVRYSLKSSPKTMAARGSQMDDIKQSLIACHLLHCYSFSQCALLCADIDG